MFLLISLLPRNFVSRLCGIVARWEFPHWIQFALNRCFVGLFSIEMSEAERPISEYSSIEDVFIRRLRPGVRAIEGDWVSPCDGQVVRSSHLLNKDQALQAKNIWYSPRDLSATDHDWCWSTTVYLAPHNYHRVHAPSDALLKAIRYLPGTLWPVNDHFVPRIPGLFCQNERLVFDFDLKKGGRLSLIMVGALNVGRMTSPFLPDFASNTWFPSPQSFDFESPIDVACGQEIGVFMLGSTVVMLMDTVAVQWIQPELMDNRPIVLGQSLKGVV